jgi:hypothetical protein
MEVDILPTILELIGIPIPESVQGQSLYPSLFGEIIDRESVPIYAYVNPGDILAVGQDPLPATIIWNKRKKNGIDWRLYGYRGIRTRNCCYVVRSNLKWKNQQRILYRLDEDPYQLNPVDYHEMTTYEREFFDREVRYWLKKMGDPFLKNIST